MSRIGTTLCALYAVVTALCCLLALSAGDYKGSFVLLQLPIAPQAALAVWLGLGPWLAGLNWSEAYLVLGGSTLGAFYLAGWLIDRARREAE
jgi:hypothetical protein